MRSPRQIYNQIVDLLTLSQFESLMFTACRPNGYQIFAEKVVKVSKSKKVAKLAGELVKADQDRKFEQMLEAMVNHAIENNLTVIEPGIGEYKISKKEGA